MKQTLLRSILSCFERCSRKYRPGVSIWALVLAFMGWGPLFPTEAAEAEVYTLTTQTQVDSTGVFLDQILSNNSTNGVMHVRLCDSPPVGRLMTLPRSQVQALVAAVLPDLASKAWGGAASVQISRRTRQLPEAEILQALHGHLLKNAVRDDGELEIRFLRLWNPVTIADENYVLRVSELPQSGLVSVFQLRFELVAGRETLGAWQIGLEARLYRNIWVAQKLLRRGDAVTESDFALERRDVLRTRDALTQEVDMNRGWQMAENLNPGSPVLHRSLQLRAVVQRGQLVDAMLKEGQISISLKAEVLDPGVPGQLIRLRNPLSRKELRGKVINDQMVQIQM